MNVQQQNSNLHT